MLAGAREGDGGRTDEGCETAELERALLDCGGGLAHEKTTDAGGAGEGDLADGRAGAELEADLLGEALGRDDVNDSL